MQPIRVTVDGQQVGSDLVAPGTAFTQVSVPFSIGTAGPHTIRLAGTDASGDKSTFIDEVVITR